MKYFDTFDENGVFQFSADEADVHYKGLWHKVIRIWLFDSEGNIYLRIRKEDKKLDCITELHVESSESIVNCFDRGLFEKIGVHLPATSNVEMAHIRKKKMQKTFSDNSEFRDNYFLCDYIGEFQNNTSYYIFSDDTDGLLKMSARGVLNLLSTRNGEIIGYYVKPLGEPQNERRFIKIDDIYNDRSEDLYTKYNFVVNAIIKNASSQNKSTKEDEKIKMLINKSRSLKLQDNYKSHSDENDGDYVY